MKIQEQACTLEQGKRLEELGVKGMPLFCHCHVHLDSENSTVAILPTGFDLNIPDLGTTWIAPAFTVAELGAMLPDYNRGLGNLEIGKCETDHITMKALKKGWWNISYWTWTGRRTRNGDYVQDQTSNHLQQKNTAAEVMAAMLIHLLENKLVTVEEVNARLCAD